MGTQGADAYEAILEALDDAPFTNAISAGTRPDDMSWLLKSREHLVSSGRVAAFFHAPLTPRQIANRNLLRNHTL